jgi:hypothetical protein
MDELARLERISMRMRMRYKILYQTDTSAYIPFHESFWKYTGCSTWKPFQLSAPFTDTLVHSQDTALIHAEKTVRTFNLLFLIPFVNIFSNSWHF